MSGKFQGILVSPKCMNSVLVYSIRDSVCSNDDPRLTFDLMARLNLCPHAFV